MYLVKETDTSLDLGSRIVAVRVVSFLGLFNILVIRERADIEVAISFIRVVWIQIIIRPWSLVVLDYRTYRSNMALRTREAGPTPTNNTMHMVVQ
jgi:hypothetical protein